LYISKSGTKEIDPRNVPSKSFNRAAFADPALEVRIAKAALTYLSTRGPEHPLVPHRRSVSCDEDAARCVIGKPSASVADHLPLCTRQDVDPCCVARRTFHVRDTSGGYPAAVRPEANVDELVDALLGGPETGWLVEDDSRGD